MNQPQQNGARPSHPHAGEQGYLLLGLLFLFVIILIGLALAAPKVAKEIQREKEVETVHRGEQYKRAIQLYYRKFGAYPMSMDQLKETNQVRFLRQQYIDPMTGKKDWKLLHLGQVQMTTLGFFGQVVQAGGAMPVAGMPGANGTTATGMLGAEARPVGSAAAPLGPPPDPVPIPRWAADSTAIPIPIAATPSSTTLPVPATTPRRMENHPPTVPTVLKMVHPCRLTSRGRKLLPATVLQMTIPAALVAQNRPPAPRPIAVPAASAAAGSIPVASAAPSAEVDSSVPTTPRAMAPSAAQTAPQAFLVWRAAP